MKKILLGLIIILMSGCVVKRDIKKEWLIQQYQVYYMEQGYTNVVVTPLY